MSGFDRGFWAHVCPAAVSLEGSVAVDVALGVSALKLRPVP
jgi:hypothetical protein